MRLFPGYRRKTGESFTEEMIFGLHLRRSRSLPEELEWVRSGSSGGTTYIRNTEIKKKGYRGDQGMNQESNESSLIVINMSELLAHNCPLIFKLYTFIWKSIVEQMGLKLGFKVKGRLIFNKHLDSLCQLPQQEHGNFNSILTTALQTAIILSLTYRLGT